MAAIIQASQSHTDTFKLEERVAEETDSRTSERMTILRHPQAELFRHPNAGTGSMATEKQRKLRLGALGSRKGEPG